MKYLSALLFFLLFAVSGFAYATDDNEVGRSLLKAVRYAELSRVTLDKNCRTHPAFSSQPRLVGLCKKRDLIPDTVVEDAALPYLRTYVSEVQAKRAIQFLSSPKAQVAISNTLRRMQTGQTDLVTPEDSSLLAEFEKTEFGEAFVRFGNDPEVNRAIARATQTYEP